ncbi:RsmE family RNA methyltransferase [Rubrobacter indicoceani]|uniref:RsmE family RNA methyltransferase n=1 Tax=Rubrobacter indicoceani TaxID=2051957 RepID=UPI000E5B3014|nr:RsmE family RNA methyltransferase [Rubrobacter indicoceani]
MSGLTRIFVASEPEPGEAFDLPAEDARHLGTVLRAKPGDEFEIVTASGRVCVARFGDRGTAVVVAAFAGAFGPARRVVLYQAVPKGKRMEVVVEKAVEVGVDGIVPLLTERSVVRPGEGAKLDRWRRIAESAARQSLRRGIPQILEPTSFTKAVRGAGSGVILHNAPELPFLEEVLGSAGGDVSLFVGPEGGFTDGELQLASEAGIAAAQMGPFRLRSETAGLVAVVRARAVIELAGSGVSGTTIGASDDDYIAEGRG